jgi:hypothetical protein
MDWNKILSLPLNVYNAIKEDAENSILLGVSIGLTVIFTVFGYPAIGFSVTAGALVGKTLWEMIKTRQIRKGVTMLVNQQLDLLTKLENASKEIEDLRGRLKNRRNRNKNNNVPK